MGMRHDIVLLSTELEIGETIRTECPRCGGGRTREQTLTVTRTEDGCIWNCYRASCENSGATGSKVGIIQREVQQKPRATFTGRTRALPEKYKQWITDHWGIEEPPWFYFTQDYGPRIAMSVRSPKYTHRGWVLRDISGQAKAKALTFLEPGEESLSWYKTRERDAPVVVVEDIPSAIRASRYVNSVALLGTNMSATAAGEIATNSSKVVLALDQDATEKSFKLMKRYGLLWKDVRVLPIHKDFKDMPEYELEGYLGAIQ